MKNNKDFFYKYKSIDFQYKINKKLYIKCLVCIGFILIIFNLNSYTINSTELNNNEEAVHVMGNSFLSIPIKNNNVVDIIRNVSSSVVSINIVSPNVLIFDHPILSRSAGSGIIYSEDEDKVYILTNYHVVSGANSVTVSLDDNIHIPAHYLGSDINSDLAIIYFEKLKLDEKDYKYTVAKFGDSSRVEVGESVVAIGNALGEGKTATIGIISSINKNINIQGIKLNVLQTDAAINPGNSGGALVNYKSEVIGINTAKLSSAGIEGMGFSIKANDAKKIADKIINNENLDKIYLGIQAIDINEQMTKIYGLPDIGIYVADIIKGSNAYFANVKVGDIIVGFNDKKVTSMAELSDVMKSIKSGDKVNIYIYRDGNVPLVLKAAMQAIYNGTNF